MVTLLDGGMGFELQLRGVKVPSHTESIWSALALIEDPDSVVDVHAAYIEAGAEPSTSSATATTEYRNQRSSVRDAPFDLACEFRRARTECIPASLFTTTC